MASLALEDRRSPLERGDLYLHLRLNSPASLGLPLRYAQEVLVLPTEQLTLMPNMPAWVLGLFNYRNHVIWAVDLSHLLGFAPLEQGLVDHLLAILRIDEQVIAAAVAQVKGVIRLSPERIEWGGASQVDHSPSLPGKTVLANETLLILDPEALARQTGFAVSPLTD